jgi:hypothetical protein
LPAGAVLELPTSAGRVDPQFRYQYMTLVHGHRVVNGHSGHVTPILAFLTGGHSPVNDIDHVDDLLPMLRGIGVTYLVVHAADFEHRELADAIGGAIDRHPEHVDSVRRFGGTIVASLKGELPPHSPDNLRRLPAFAMSPRANRADDRLPLLFDGDRDSRWLTGSQQSGTEQIDIDFDRPRDVRLVRMSLGVRSFGDYPRLLAVESVGDDGTRTLFRGPTLPQLARGLIADGQYPSIDILLPENRSKSIRLRQLGTTRRFFWSIHELQLWEQ